jgi:hypothetical protein
MLARGSVDLEHPSELYVSFWDFGARKGSWTSPDAVKMYL